MDETRLEQGKFKPLAAFNVDVPHRIAALIERALHPEADQRPSAAEIESELQTVPGLLRHTTNTVQEVNVGVMIGQYQLIEPIGRGGQAVVWKAEQLNLERHVALKLIDLSLFSSMVEREEFAKRFMSEAKIVVPVTGSVDK